MELVDRGRVFSVQAEVRMQIKALLTELVALHTALQHKQYIPNHSGN